MSPAVHHASKACLPGAQKKSPRLGDCVLLTSEVHLFDNLLCLRLELSIARSDSSARIVGSWSWRLWRILISSYCGSRNSVSDFPSIRTFGMFCVSQLGMQQGGLISTET